MQQQNQSINKNILNSFIAVADMSNKQAPIFILGGGAWGLSTALHLSRAGHTNITVFERAETIPSPYSAAYDLNKIVRPEYEDSFYTGLALVRALR